ncbi:MAG: DUF4832 domain-containing protein [Lachnospiraceae bacterium]|nr:DUF4832 domain-containing protein [Lachnospiraceae bacterium]
MEKHSDERKKRINKKAVVGIIGILILLFCVFFYTIYPKLRRVTYSATTLSESTEVIQNPYCGWYQVFAYTLTGIPAPESVEKDKKDLEEDCSLALLEIDLKNFKDTEISEEALQELDSILEVWRCSDAKLILRFVYDLEGNAQATEPSTVEEVCSHMKQVAPYVNKYKDSVYLCQGLFVGNWGEMHGTALCNRTDFLTLLSVWNHEIDSSIFLAVRTPEIWREMLSSLKPITEDEAYTGKLNSRLSLFNDGMLGSITDVGTYDEEASFSEITNYMGKGNRQEEISFQNKLCLFVPNGGEVINDNEYNDLENAVTSLSEMRVSYLNIEYDEAVINKWKSSEIDGENGFKYISKKLGYRYVLEDSDVSGLSFSGQKATYKIDISNQGFAPSYRKFSTTLTLVHTKTKEVKEVKVSADNRLWYPGEDVTLNGTIDCSKLENGYYKLYISMMDSETQQAVSFANTLEKEEYGYCLGQIAIRQK